MRKPNFWMMLLLAALVVVGIGALWFLGDPSPRRGGLPRRFDYNLDPYMKIDPALVRYRQDAVVPVRLYDLRAIAVGPDDAIHVAGDRTILVFDAQGKRLRRMDLTDAPRALAVDAQGNSFVAFQNYLLVFNNRGETTAQWESSARRDVFTSVALGDNGDVFVADAGNKCVLRYDRSGKIIGKLAQGDPRNHVPPPVIPSPYFDVAVGSDGLVRVVNPGRHRIEFFTPDGHHETPLDWGSAGMDVEAFCGCCNPVAIALLADNRVVTAEKGIPRVKVYSPEGRFESVVATPEQLGATPGREVETREQHKLLAVDLAVDSQDRILVLDPDAKAVRVFVEQNTKDAKDTKDVKNP
ncbi:MAG: NHL repeat-containing protein [Pirellulales bacterium]|nr:NHL repeat-containing protein [Pirellulales bacterium]